MTQYSQLKKLKSATKNETEVTLDFSSNLFENSSDETNFPHKILFADTQFSKIQKAFENGLSANIKFSKTQLFKLIQSGRILGELLVALPYAALKAGAQELMKRVPELTKRCNKIFYY